MQLAEALAILKEIQDCAETESMDAGLRLGWIGHRAAEAQAVAEGNYFTAEYHKHQCNCMAALMRMYARAAAMQPIIIGREVPAEGDHSNGR